MALQRLPVGGMLGALHVGGNSSPSGKIQIPVLYFVSSSGLA